MKQLILITLIWLFTAPAVNAEVLYSHTFTNSQSTICYREGKAMLCYSPSKHKHMRHQRMIPMSNSHVVQQTHQHTHQHNEHKHNKVDKVLDTAIKIAILKEILDK